MGKMFNQWLVAQTQLVFQHLKWEVLTPDIVHIVHIGPTDRSNKYKQMKKEMK